MSGGGERWSFEWRRTWTEVWSDSFMRQWQDWYDSSALRHVYHRPALARAWADTIGATTSATPFVGVATASTGAKLLLPWIVVSYRGRFIVRRTLEPLGGAIFAYHSPLVLDAVPDSIDWPAFWSAARTEAAGVADQALFRLLEPAFASGFVGQTASESSPVLALDSCTSLDDLLSRCRSSHRIDVRRQMRRMREAGATSLWIAGCGDGDRVRNSVRGGLLPAYRAAWARRAEVNRLLGPGLESFLDRLIDVGVREGWVHYAVLTVDTVPVAWHLGFVDRRRLYWWLPAHDLSWANYSPSKVLLAFLIDHGCRSGWSAIHLLTGAQEHKTAWHPVPQQLVAVTWVAPTLRGRLMVWYDSRHTS